MTEDLYDLDDDPIDDRADSAPGDDGDLEDLFADLPTTGDGHGAAAAPAAPVGPGDRPPPPEGPRWAATGSADPGGRPGPLPRGPSARGPAGPTVEELLRQAIDMVASARRAPLSASVLIARDELLDVLQQALELVPEEVRQARRLLRDRQEFLEQRQREADELIETVRAEAQRMVQRSEVVRQARQAAQRLVDEAREEARRLRHEAEEYCDRELAKFEIVLERTARTVRAGRERLAQMSGPVDQPDEPDTAGGAPAAAVSRGAGRLAGSHTAGSVEQERG